MSAKKKLAKAPSRGNSLRWIFCLVCFVMLAAYVPFAAVAVALGLLPTLSIVVIDRSVEKLPTYAVGGANIAGIIPFLPDFVLHGRHIDLVHDLLGTITMFAAMFGAAAFGWVLLAIMPVVMQTFADIESKRRRDKLREQQQRLMHDWGPQVNCETKAEAR
ncbi:MAG: hypothetical protein IPK66_17095 [Rhodospirillales bacterium]|nr:hypothetical protein [Rhodospirillales bacterium]